MVFGFLLQGLILGVDSSDGSEPRLGSARAIFQKAHIEKKWQNEATSDREMHQRVLRKIRTRELPHVEKAFSNEAINKLTSIQNSSKNLCQMLINLKN